MTQTTYDWQDRKVVEDLADTLMTEIRSWREDNGRKGNESSDRTDLMRAIVYAGQKLDAFQMARYLEDSRLWPADQALVLQLRPASSFRDRILAELNRPPAPPVVEGEVRVGIHFSVGSTIYEVLEGPDQGDFFKIRDLASGSVIGGIFRKTIQGYIDRERTALLGPNNPHGGITNNHINTGQTYPHGLRVTDTRWDYVIKAGPDGRDDYDVTVFKAGHKTSGLAGKVSGTHIGNLIQRHGIVTTPQPSATPPAPGPNTAHSYPIGTMFTDGVWNFMVLSGPDAIGDYQADAYDGAGNHQGLQTISGSSITHHLQKHGAAGAGIPLNNTATGGIWVSVTKVSIGMTFKGDSGRRFRVTRRQTGDIWDCEVISNGDTRYFDEQAILDAYKRNGP